MQSVPADGAKRQKQSPREAAQPLPSESTATGFVERLQGPEVNLLQQRSGKNYLELKLKPDASNRYSVCVCSFDV